MATFEAQIEATTGIKVENSGTAPTQGQLTQFLDDGIKDYTNKLLNTQPQELFKFSTDTTVTDGTGAEIKGKLMSVVRQNGGDGDVRIASEIPIGLRTRVQDSTSFNYRTAYNPVFYKSGNKVYVLPEPTSSSNAIITHTNYATTGYSQSAISSFPDEYENLVVLYAAAMTCQAAAVDIQNNMPNKPIPPAAPIFVSANDRIAMPSVPVYNPPSLDFHMGSIISAVSKEDYDKADKQMEILEKRFTEYDKTKDRQEKLFQQESDLFKAKVELDTKNLDRDFQIEAGQYRSDIYKYQYDISKYQADLQESMTKYKWFIEQYATILNEYNKGVMMSIGQVRKPQEAQAPQQQVPQQEIEGTGGGE